MAIYKDKNLNGIINLIRLHPGLISSLNRNEEKVEKNYDDIWGALAQP